MQVTFLGVGEACDERYPNTALLLGVEADERKRSVLLDCGFTAACRLWQWMDDPEQLDIVYISHFHGDHFFGVPVLLLRLWEMMRTRELCFVGQPGIGSKVETAMDLAYPHFRAKLKYPLRYVEMEADGPLQLAGLHWSCAESRHGQRNFSVRIDCGEKSLFYSGDGCPSAATEALATGCSLVVHEAFAFVDEMIPGHGTVKGSVEFARRVGARRLALVHIQRDVRRQKQREIEDYIAAVEDVEVLLPEPGDVLAI